MRRACVVMVVAGLVAFVGCGRESYQKRLTRTIEGLKYKQRLGKNLMEPPSADKKFTDLAIYVRPPKEEAPAKTVGLPVAEGQFDLEASFLDKTDSVLHVLARVKMPKKALAKGAPPPPPPPARGEFVNDVLAVLSNVFGAPEALQTPKFGEENKKGNRFKRLIFTAGEKEVRLYTYKQDNHEVALIFAYPPGQKAAMASKIDLCLESFATGAPASRLYTGGAPEEEPEAGGAGPL